MGSNRFTIVTHMKGAKLRNDVDITRISDYLIVWEDYMPTDITENEVKKWENDPNPSSHAPKDARYAVSYMGSRLVNENIVDVEGAAHLTVALGVAMFFDKEHSWKIALDKMTELRKKK